jgi:peroxiredoxin
LEFFMRNNRPTMLALLVLSASGAACSERQTPQESSPLAVPAPAAEEIKSAARREAPVPPGQAAPPFALKVAGEDRRVSLADELQKHEATVLLFIATKCPYSNAYNERMAKLPARYEGTVGFLGINSNHSEPDADVAAHASQHGFSFPVLKDDENRVADAYGATKTPEVFVVGRDGAVLYHGRIDESYEDATAVQSPDLHNALQAILGSLPVPAPTTKAFGCSIKRI